MSASSTAPSASTCDDCTSLTELDEASIMDNLKARYGQEQIYTYT